jgi:hypothetical protein
MKMRSAAIFLATMVGLCVVTGAILYFCANHRQNEGMAFLKALSDVRVGTTSKNEFTQKMIGFNKFESASTPSTWFEGKQYEGVGYGIDNSIFNKYLMFPETNLAAGVFFDSDNIVKGISVTLERKGILYATLDERPRLAAAAASNPRPWAGRSQQLIHLVIDPAHREDFSHLSVFCFTSWSGCNTARDLLPLDN